MNCKPGDLAVIVKPETTTRNLGKLVLVLHADARYPGEWLVESMSGEGRMQGGHRAMRGFIPDARLRPIRDPGDDAVDEMVHLLGKPEGVPA